MKCTTSWASAASKAASGNGSASADACADSTSGRRSPQRLDERRRRVDGGDVRAPSAGDELGVSAPGPLPTSSTRCPASMPAKSASWGASVRE